jgi:hypothetical protein
MTKASVKEVNQIIAHCEGENLCIKEVFAQLLAGTKSWDAETGVMTDITPKLTKPEQEAKELADAAKSAVEQIMVREGSEDFSVDFIKREACKLFTDLYIAKPKLFKQAVQVAINEHDKSLGDDFKREEIKPKIKATEIMPSMVEWAKEQGCEIGPMPDQDPALKKFV